MPINQCSAECSSDTTATIATEVAHCELNSNPNFMSVNQTSIDRGCSASALVSCFRSSSSSSNSVRNMLCVTFAPLPPPRNKEVTMAPSTMHQKRKPCFEKSKGFRGDYSLGETARSPSDLIIQPTSDQSFQAVNSLKKHDFAFVKRSDGHYSYSILAFRSLELPDEGSISKSLEECMAFVMSNAGRIKMIKREQWGEFVRLVSTEERDQLPSFAKDKQNRKKSLHNGEKDDWFLPSIISFVPIQSGEFDDVSVLENNPW